MVVALCTLYSVRYSQKKRSTTYSYYCCTPVGSAPSSRPLRHRFATTRDKKKKARKKIARMASIKYSLCSREHSKIQNAGLDPKQRPQERTLLILTLYMHASPIYDRCLQQCSLYQIRVPAESICVHVQKFAPPLTTRTSTCTCCCLDICTFLAR